MRGNNTHHKTKRMYNGASHKTTSKMDKTTFSDLQQLENTVFSYIVSKKGQTVRAFSMGAVLKHYGQVETIQMCVRKDVRSSDGLEMVAFVRDGENVKRLTYSSSSVFVRFLKIRMKDLDIQIGKMNDTDWKAMLNETERRVKLA